MGYPKEAVFEELRTIAAGALTANFTAVGAAFTGPIRLIGITNLTDQDVIFSIDGVTDHVIIPTGAGKVFDISTNRTNQENFFLMQGKYAYIRHLAGLAPQSGSVYVECLYG